MNLKVALAQLNFLVGDVQGNTALIIATAQRAQREQQADLVLFPELALCGYPPEDLLFHRGFRRQIEAALQQLCTEIKHIAVVVGYPEYADGHIYNAAAVIADGKVQAQHRKLKLPNYRVFDEKRYFEPGDKATVFDFKGIRLGLCICEDIWEVAPVSDTQKAGAQALLVINASPYQLHKQREREAVARQRIARVNLPMLYLHGVGGQDELIFDGNSFVMDAAGELICRLPAFTETLAAVTLSCTEKGQIVPQPADIASELSDAQSVYQALVLGVRDYVNKHGFPGVVMGLSGGIDSALTLAIAVDALGAQRVHAVMMPSRYTSTMSLEDAAAQADKLQVKYSVISIEDMFAATLQALSAEFANRPPDTTEENIQSRCRMQLLMGISNKTGKMLLTTGNKSEMAVGYATLYGDMAGGFAPIKDCSKQLVYRLAQYRNTQNEVIPQRVMERAPSAELRPEQRDSDSLPPYDILDAILEAFIEEDLSVDEIVARGFERETVGRVLDLVKRNEYKRRQAPPGVRVSRRAFGRDWRYPITNGYRR
jgi:NAD+ synthase (glutamine-hydrolysing)